MRLCHIAFACGAFLIRNAPLFFDKKIGKFCFPGGIFSKYVRKNTTQAAGVRFWSVCRQVCVRVASRMSCTVVTACSACLRHVADMPAGEQMFFVLPAARTLVSVALRTIAGWRGSRRCNVCSSVLAVWASVWGRTVATIRAASGLPWASARITSSHPWGRESAVAVWAIPSCVAIYSTWSVLPFCTVGGRGLSCVAITHNPADRQTSRADRRGRSGRTMWVSPLVSRDSCTVENGVGMARAWQKRQRLPRPSGMAYRVRNRSEGAHAGFYGRPLHAGRPDMPRAPFFLMHDLARLRNK